VVEEYSQGRPAPSRRHPGVRRPTPPKPLKGGAKSAAWSVRLRSLQNAKNPCCIVFVFFWMRFYPGWRPPPKAGGPLGYNFRPFRASNRPKAPKPRCPTRRSTPAHTACYVPSSTGGRKSPFGFLVSAAGRKFSSHRLPWEQRWRRVGRSGSGWSNTFGRHTRQPGSALATWASGQATPTWRWSPAGDSRAGG